MTDVFYFQEQGDDRAVAMWRGRRIGFICADGWYLNSKGKVYWGEAEGRAAAAAGFTRHFFEWLRVTTHKEMTESVHSAA